jgi:hypothetical protein
MTERTVVFYGQSLLLSLVGAGIGEGEDLRVVRASTWAQVEALSAALALDVLVYDLAVTSEIHILPLLFRNPNLLLIGLDPETNRAVLLTGSEAHSLTMEQMREIVATGCPSG